MVCASGFFGIFISGQIHGNFHLKKKIMDFTAAPVLGVSL